MIDRSTKGIIAINLSFVVAFLLTVLPLPQWMEVWRPAWIVLVLIFWCMATPDRVGVFVGCLLGLLLDAMTGALLGQHALLLGLVAYLALRFRHPIWVFHPYIQAFCVLVIVFLYQLLNLCIHGLYGNWAVVWADEWGWRVVLTSSLLWPWLSAVLVSIRRKYEEVA